MLPYFGLLPLAALSMSMEPASPLASMPPSEALSTPDSSLDSRVVGGKKVEKCQWPSTTILDTGRFTCSSTLVHPRIVITAAHCLKGNNFTVYTGDGNKGEHKASLIERPVEYCRKHPDFKGTSNTPTKDFAYCKLREPVKDVAPMPIAMGCEADYIMENSDLEVTVVGFGYTTTSKTNLGNKYEVDTKYLGMQGGLAQVGVKGKGPLQGDSGGPVFIKLPEDKFNKDAGWRVFGITSTSRGSGNPDGRALYGMVHTFVEYLEKDSGIDVTPCTNAKGEWEPTKDCKGAFSDPYEASGDWVTGCEPATPGGYISSCGDAFEGGESDDDTKAPKVKITSPKDGQVFTKGAKVKVAVEAKDDGEIRQVQLKLDGKALDADTKAPYKWTLEDLKVGEHELLAIAVDEAGNEGESKSLSFKVKAGEKGDTPDSDDDSPGAEDDSDEEASDESDDAGSDKGDDASDESDKKSKDDDEDDEGADDPGTGSCSLAPSPISWQGLSLLALGALIRRKRQRQA